MGDKVKSQGVDRLIKDLIGEPELYFQCGNLRTLEREGQWRQR